MHTCPGPCLHPESQNTYSSAVQQACTAAAGRIEFTIQRLSEKMKEASGSMRFEQAAAFKKQIECLRKLSGNDFKWTHDLQDLCILHIDVCGKRKIAGKNKKRHLYKAWKITAENVHELGIFVPKTSDQILSFLHQNWNKGKKLVYTPKNKEHLGVLSLFIFRSNQAGLWLDCTCGIPETALNDFILTD